MSQYKITKARLSQIIKEEYQSLHEEVRPAAPPNALMKNINRWSEEGKDIPKHLTVGGRMGGDRVALHQLQGMLHSLQDDFVPYLDGTEEHEIYELVNNLMGLIKTRLNLSPGQRTEALTGDQKEMDEDGDGDIDQDDLAAKRDKKKVKKESVASLRDLIHQELQNL
jgi:hypothetical protein